MSLSADMEDIIRRTKEIDALFGLIKFTEHTERHLRRFVFAYVDINTQQARDAVLEELARADGTTDYGIEEGYLEERALANLYGVMAHLYTVVGGLREMFDIKYTASSTLGGEEGHQVDTILGKLNAYAHRLIRFEAYLKQKGFTQGLDFSPVEDYSFKQEPHWGDKERFAEFFGDLRDKVQKARARDVRPTVLGYPGASLGNHISQRYQDLNTMLVRLDHAKL